MRIQFGLCLLTAVVANAADVSVTMNRYDPGSLAANTQEHVLNATNVNPSSFGKLRSYYVDGAVYAQPLYVSGVLYVVTMNDKAYAFDTTKAGPPLWVRDFTNEASGVTPVPITDMTNNDNLNVVGNIGIEGTPVIDSQSRSMFLVARTKEDGAYVQRLHKLNLDTGQDRTPPKLIEASVPGSAVDAVDGRVHFDPKAGNQRPALMLSHGNVLIAWASHEDLRPYHGWIMAYRTEDLNQTGALCITPDGADGGVWQSGRGPAVDVNGDAFFEVGNGTWDGKRNFGDSVIKVHIDANGLHVQDFYTPADYGRQNQTDADLGSTGPMLLPHSNALICGDKEGEMFTLDKNHLGGLSQRPVDAVDLRGGRVMGGPAFWDGPNAPTLYVWNESTVLQALRVNGTALSKAGKAQVFSHGSPGGALTVSSDRAKPGTGIVWATVGRDRSADHGNAPGVLHAFDAETLQDLWNSEMSPKRDRMGTLVKFVPPLVVDGRVYVTNYDNSVDVYGLF